MRHSAGIVVQRDVDGRTQILLGHMGGPFWARKDEGAWSIPKGEFDSATETAWDAARREFREELGIDVPDGEPEALGEFRVTSGKSLTAFRLHGSVDLAAVVFGTFELEWPPRSGRIQEFPELDRAEWVELDRAGVLLTKGQRPILAALSVSGTD
ncbi:NUDIX domain-containing protein [Tessaracoccus defluvii]|uniref:NUDIX domain-containing protein n=1 Tax=Tessaracoccus defluvii TaxID=1285901 RepID=A0A7H0H297_9ACTN|nr:NUDIX domain-containing protein [Tessaracoccus defluvii]QNP54663.1 NUDIX domain-containing protein [Tessaracoccus defluvii]